MENQIQLTTNTQVTLESIDLLTANNSFYHIDRIAPFHVLIYCIKGCIYVGEDDCGTQLEYEVLPGELLLLKKGLHQYPTKRIEAGTSWIYAHFYTDEPDNLINHTENNSVSNLTDSESSSKISLSLPKKTEHLRSSEIEDNLRNLVDLALSSDDIKLFRVPVEFHRILLELFEWSYGFKPTDLADDIEKFLYTEINTHLSAEQLEAHFHLSYKYMEHVFKPRKGISIMQYHTKLRIKESAKTLRATAMSIAAISEMYGFNDQLYFSRCFKKHMGMSPREYRTTQTVL